MTAARSLDVADLPVYSISNRAPLWWGQFLMCVIEGSMLCMLIAIYFYLRLGVDVWPPPGAQLPFLKFPTLALVPLAISTLGSYWASEAAKKNDRRGMVMALSLNFGMGVVFLVFRFAEWRTLNFTWSTDAHGTIVWSILFLHTFDMIADLLMTLMLVIILASGIYGPKQRLGVHVDSVIWYFLAGIWLPLYAVIYWGPRIVGSP
jgi:heme/copper-type cytochrome/quinol oxidase subunit 3